MTDDIQFLPDIDNPVQLRINGQSIHSRHADKEADRQNTEILSHHPSVVILFSPGLGFLIKKLLAWPKLTIVYIEPNAVIRNVVLRQLQQNIPTPKPNTGNIISDTVFSQTRFVVASKWEAGLLDTLPKPISRWYLFYLKSTLTHDQAETIQHIENLKFRESVNVNTLRKFDRIWLKNLYYNLSTAANINPLTSLAGRHKGKPAVIASAGPSLDKLLPVLAKHRHRYILIAVDTVVAPLRHYGIDPDYLLSVDAQSPNFLHIRSYTGKAQQIFDITMNYMVLRHLQPGFTTFHNPLPAAALALQTLFHDHVGQLQFGGSVATNAFDLALQMQCEPIYLCGLDLAFVENRIHCRGSALETVSQSKTNRLLTTELQNYRQITAIDRRWVYNSKRQPVATNDKLIIFYDWFKTHLSGKKVIHVDGGGVVFDTIASIQSFELDQSLAGHDICHPIKPDNDITTHQVQSTDTFDLLSSYFKTLTKAEQLIRTYAATEAQTVAHKLIEFDSQQPVSFLKLISSGMQNQLLSINDHLSAEEITQFYHELETSIQLHLKLLSKCRQFASSKTI